jgi:hypothetical protein
MSPSIRYATAIRLGFAALAFTATLRAHESSRLRALLAQTNSPATLDSGPRAPVRLEIVRADTSEALVGLVRITSLSTGKHVTLPAHLGRPMGWYSLPANALVDVPVGEVRIEACHGLETEITSQTLRVTRGAEPQRVRLTLRSFFNSHAKGFVSANTHLHLQLSTRPVAGAVLRTRTEAEDYLRTTAASDALDFVYVSHLVRSSEDQNYVSNGFTRADLQRWSGDRMRFINGQEHRHEGGRSTRRGGPDELRFGHVLFLDLPQLVQPVSYGAIFNPQSPASDAIPMRRAIQAARTQKSAIIWCHGKQGTEDVSNWIDGLLDAQNIFDGGNDGNFDAVFYPYLNAGLRVPFSTGTDWGSYDLSRVYVPLAGDKSSAAFLRALSAGRSFITNGPLLEFEVDGHRPGDEIKLTAAKTVRLRARALGRDDFTRLEIVHNGNIVARQDTRRQDGHFVADFDTTLAVDAPGWLALRVPTTQPYNDRTAYTGAGANLFGKALFAHTSAIYVTLNGKNISTPSAIQDLIAEIKAGIHLIESKGAFANDAERDTLLATYRNAATKLQARLPPGSR